MTETTLERLHRIQAELSARKSEDRRGGFDVNQLARAVSHGMTLGYSDELAAAGDGAVAALTGGDFSKTYDKSLARERALLEGYRENHPGQAATAEIGGAIASGMAMPAARGLFGAVGLGAATGAVAGFGSSEGGPVERAKGALVGGATGGALSGAVGAAARGGQAALRALGRNDTVTRLAGARISEALAERGTTAAQVARKLRRSDKPLRVVDMEGRTPGAIRNLGDSAVTQSGGRGARLRGEIEERQLGQFQRITNDLDKLMPEGDLSRPIDDLVEEWRKVNLYKAVPMADKITGEGADELVALLKSKPKYEQYFKRAQKEAAGFGEAFPESFDDVTIDAVDKIKRALDDQIGTLTRAGKKGLARRHDVIRREMLEAVDGLEPRYKAARSKWAAEERLREASEAGMKAATGSERPRAIQRFVAKATDDEIALYRAGAVDGIRMRLGKMQDQADLMKLFQTPDFRARFRAIFGKEYRKVGKDLVDEMRMSTTNKRVGTGSQTALRQAPANDLGREVAAAGVDAAAGTPGVSFFVTRLARLLPRRQPDMSEDVARKVAETLFETDKDRAVALLMQLERAGGVESAVEGVGSGARRLGVGAAAAGGLFNPLYGGER